MDQRSELSPTQARQRGQRGAHAARLKEALERRPGIVRERFAATATPAPPQPLTTLTTLTTEQGRQRLRDPRDPHAAIPENLPELTDSWTDTDARNPRQPPTTTCPPPSSWLTNPPTPSPQPPRQEDQQPSEGGV
jgi:hypothetical protein